MSRKRSIAIVVAVGLAIVLSLVTRAVWQGRTALSRGDVALEAGRIDEAIGHWRRAARWYVPLAPHVGTAYERLEDTAKKAGAAGDQRVALSAWRGIRSSIMATRSFYTPHGERLENANAQIAALMASLEGAAADPGKSEAQRAQWHKDLLDRPVGPSVGYSILAIVGFLVWLVGAFWFAWAGLDAETERLNKPVALRCGLAIVLGLLVWLTGLFLA